MIKVQQSARTMLANPLSILLNKPRSEFTRQDLLRAIKHYGIERITFHYTGLDGFLKELRLPFSDINLAERILAAGERVDGSSLFKGLVDASVSDLYVVPRYCTAFLNPFDSKSLDFMCRFLKSDGNFAEFPPDNILSLAHAGFKQRTGYDLYALGELEFYLIKPPEDPCDLYPVKPQGGYHTSAPFFKNGSVIDEITRCVQLATESLKYAHAEVGSSAHLRSDNPVLNNNSAEQYELEFRPRPIEDMGDYISLTRWIISNIASKHGLLATFAPKIEEDIAGSGLHIHMALMKNGVNQMLDSESTLTSDAIKLIGGIINYAPTLSAFGNTVAASYLRLVPNHEAPTKICWSYSNRSSLVRIPLGWGGVRDLAKMVNPQEAEPYTDMQGQQTVELRSPDGSAKIYLLLAGIVTAAQWGLTNAESAKIAKQTQVKGNIFQDKQQAAKLASLPASCTDCAELMEKNRDLYEKKGCFPSFMIDYIIGMLKNEDDKTLNKRLSSLKGDEKLKETLKVLHRDLYKY